MGVCRHTGVGPSSRVSWPTAYIATSRRQRVNWKLLVVAEEIQLQVGPI